ncbi:DUF6907 domain-containing protein [Dermabacteraceae bacterium P13088]
MTERSELKIVSAEPFGLKCPEWCDQDHEAAYWESSGTGSIEHRMTFTQDGHEMQIIQLTAWELVAGDHWEVMAEAPSVWFPNERLDINAAPLTIEEGENFAAALGRGMKRIKETLGQGSVSVEIPRPAELGG